MTKQNTIFKLIEIEYCTDDNPQYPEFDVYRTVVGYFSSLEKAEQIMNKEKHNKSRNPEYKFFGFLIEEYALDITGYDRTESRRSYLPDGSLLDVTLMSETLIDENYELAEFLGRPTDKVRFQVGDLVEVLYGNTVSLEIVGNLPITPEYVQFLKEKSRKKHNHDFFHLDFTDDSYYTLDQDGEHSHPEAINLFPVRFEVSEELKKKLFSDTYYSYRAYCDNQQEKNKS